MPNLFTVSPASSRRSLIPPIPSASPLKALANCITVHIIPPTMPPAKILPHWTFPFSSAIKFQSPVNIPDRLSLRIPNTVFIASQITSARDPMEPTKVVSPSRIPFTRPAIMNPPMVIITVEGEWMPRISQIPVMMLIAS